MNKEEKLCAVWMGILSCVESFGALPLGLHLSLAVEKGGHDNKVLSHHCRLVRSNSTHYMCMMNWLHYAQLKWLFSSSDQCCHLNNMMLWVDTEYGCWSQKCTIKKTLWCNLSWRRVYESTPTIMPIDDCTLTCRSTSVANLKIIINMQCSSFQSVSLLSSLDRMSTRGNKKGTKSLWCQWGENLIVKY